MPNSPLAYVLYGDLSLAEALLGEGACRQRKVADRGVTRAPISVAGVQDRRSMLFAMLRP